MKKTPLRHGLLLSFLGVRPQAGTRGVRMTGKIEFGNCLLVVVQWVVDHQELSTLEHTYITTFCMQLAAFFSIRKEKER